ncbi:MAG: acyltransferase [Candidatus Micrarchaeota archaeon]
MTEKKKESERKKNKGSLFEEFLVSLRERGVWLTLLRACDYACKRFWLRGVKSLAVSALLRAKGVRVGRRVVFVKDNRFVTNFTKGAIEIGDCVVFGRHTILEGKGIKIGDNATLNNYSHVMSEKRIEIGADTLVAPNCFITDYDHDVGGTRGKSGSDGSGGSSGSSLIRRRGTVAKPVLVGKNVWVGAYSIILKGVRIGDNSVVAAGSVVTRSIPRNCVAAGAPARVIRKFGARLRA